MHINKKLVTAFATGAILLNALAPLAFADTNINVTGNGSSSDNSATVTKTQDNTVVQNNSATVTNSITTDSNTGNNRANDNTGGNVAIDTGNATSVVDVMTKVNKNIANLPGCNCGSSDQVTISGNGSHSDSSVRLDSSNTNSVFQDNTAWINNNINSNANTGRNDANGNTGGDVLVRTGGAATDVAVRNLANANEASIGGNGSNGGGLTARILGNGSFSDNDLSIDADRSTKVVQSNSAWIDNHIHSNANTGNNRANDNTGGNNIWNNGSNGNGNVTIDTGNAMTRTRVDNMANFNAADLGCGCDMTLDAKIAGNGSHSSNDISADTDNSNAAFQNNHGNLSNWLTSNAKTGYNDMNRNTDFSGVDPIIFTGNAGQGTTVHNASNANVVGQGSNIQTPWGDMNLSFDLNNLW